MPLVSKYATVNARILIISRETNAKAAVYQNEYIKLSSWNAFT